MGVADKHNDTESRKTHATGQGFAHELSPKFLHGHPEEIEARVGGTFHTLPDHKPSNFHQIGPAPASGGGSLIGKQPARKRGTAKFGNPKEYI